MLAAAIAGNEANGADIKIPPGLLVNSVGSTDVLAMAVDEPRPVPRLLTRALGVGRNWVAVATLASVGTTIEWYDYFIYSTAAALIKGVEGAGNKDAVAAASMAKMLPAQPTADLATVRGELVKLSKDPAAEVRQPALAAIAAADNSFDKVYAGAGHDPAKLVDVLSAVPLVYDQDLRATMTPRVMAFLAPSTRRRVLAGFRSHVVPGGRAAIGFGADRGYPFDEFVADARAVGWSVDLQLATWDLRPLTAESDFLVAVLS